MSIRFRYKSDINSPQNTEILGMIGAHPMINVFIDPYECAGILGAGSSERNCRQSYRNNRVGGGD